MVNRIEDESVLCKKKLKLFDYTSETKIYKEIYKEKDEAISYIS